MRLHGALTLARVVLADDREPGEDTAAALTLPLADWGRRGNGDVVERAVDAALPGLTLRAHSSARPRSRLRLTYPADGGARVLPFGTLAFAVRDADAFDVTVKGVTAAGDVVELDYEAGRVSSERRRPRRTALPLTLTPRDANPYAEVRIDVGGDVAALDAGTVLAGLRSITLRGSFTVGAVQLRDPIARAGDDRLRLAALSSAPLPRRGHAARCVSPGW